LKPVPLAVALVTKILLRELTTAVVEDTCNAATPKFVPPVIFAILTVLLYRLDVVEPLTNKPTTPVPEVAAGALRSPIRLS
jgi:hypothetical protein